MTSIQKYKDLLLAAGFSEAKELPLHFFKETNSYVAFIVNIVCNDGVEICYGFSSTAFTRMSGDEMALINYGVRSEDITLREKEKITASEDEARVAQTIYEYHQRYCAVSKEELLLLAKEKRKGFVNIISDQLKPLGFKKKNSTWTYSLNENYYVSFNAQKSAYSDSYYFNIYIGLFGTNNYGDCFYTRVSPQNDVTDWQLISKEEFLSWLHTMIETDLLPIINTPLAELGAKKDIWQGCYCKREKCQNCWVEKNLWEAKGSA
ncbi:MAG: DUF4304 domain-containing protein [Oscillospiraceae bacterium]|nr:DUF4304 domain-containing protein [Oscillospiraceae bacterium]